MIEGILPKKILNIIAKVTSLVLLASLISSCCGFLSLSLSNQNHSNHVAPYASLSDTVITCNHQGGGKCPLQDFKTSIYYYSTEQKSISKPKNDTKNQNDVPFLISNYTTTRLSALTKEVSLPTKNTYFGNHQTFSVFQLPRAHLG
jgi:hypothetical protein